MTPTEIDDYLRRYTLQLDERATDLWSHIRETERFEDQWQASFLEMVRQAKEVDQVLESAADCLSGPATEHDQLVALRDVVNSLLMLVWPIIEELAGSTETDEAELTYFWNLHREYNRCLRRVYEARAMLEAPSA